MAMTIPILNPAKLARHPTGKAYGVRSGIHKRICKSFTSSRLLHHTIVTNGLSLFFKNKTVKVINCFCCRENSATKDLM